MRLLNLIFGILIGILIGFTTKPTMIDQFDMCVDELVACQDALNDPHHCVSVVVETLEGKDGK